MRVRKFLGNFLLFFIAIALIVTIAVRFINVNTYIVDSDSMYPKIPKFSLVYINEKPDLDKLDRGDVVAVQKVGSRYIHRIVEINGDMVITKGDRNTSEDAPVSKSNINGIVVFYVPYLGFLFSSIYPVVFIFLIILIFMFIQKIVKTVKEK